MNEQLQVTSGAVWRAGELVRLPSGNVARLKKPGLAAMISEDGEANDILAQYMLGPDTKQATTSPAEQLKSMRPFLDRLTTAVFVEPQVVEAPQADDEISVRDIEFQDQVFLIEWIFGGMQQAVKRFPKQQDADMAAVPAHKPNGTTSK